MDNYQLIDKVLSGLASESEQHQLNVWLKANPENQRYYEDIKLLFDPSQEEFNDRLENEEGWQKIQAAINAEKKKARRKKVIRSLVFITSLSSILLVTASLCWKFLPASANSAFTSGDSDTISYHQLPDSSIIALGANSSYRYINGWDTAVLEIKGNAYLKAGASGKPLVVTTKNMKTTVLQASLFITSTPGAEGIFLEKGQNLEVRSALQQVTLSEGLSVVLADDGFQVQSNDGNQRYWYLKEMTFVKTPLNEVIVQLKNNIGLTIYPEFDLASCHFSGAFSNDISGQEVVNTLCGYYGVVYEKMGARSYKLIGNPCQKP